MKKEITIQYYALLKEERGIEIETVETEALTAFDFYNELREKHLFSLSKESLKVVVNDEFVDWETEIKNHDVLVFIPPVSGG